MSKKLIDLPTLRAIALGRTEYCFGRRQIIECRTCQAGETAPPTCSLWARLEEVPEPEYHLYSELRNDDGELLETFGERAEQENLSTRERDCGDPLDSDGLMSYQKPENKTTAIQTADDPGKDNE